MIFSIEAFSSISNIQDLFFDPLTECFFFLFFIFFLFVFIFLFLDFILDFILNLLVDIYFFVDLASRPIDIFLFFGFFVFLGGLDFHLLEIMDHIDLIFFGFSLEFMIFFLFLMIIICDFHDLCGRSSILRLVHQLL